jgi:hypothetical protein
MWEVTGGVITTTIVLASPIIAHSFKSLHICLQHSHLPSFSTMKFLSSAFLLPFLLASTTDAFQPARAARRTTMALSITMPDYNDGTKYAMEHRDISNIIKQNGDYVKAMGQDFFDDLGAKHEPKYMWIGCADARAPANELMVRTIRKLVVIIAHEQLVAFGIVRERSRLVAHFSHFLFLWIL